ncbi:unnamed protein product [Clavelina lepadiformis]|uniref:Uncharacterized protein n=1 Tax=Clavelina lepadiformis TaxID=159417 RepID=A0ABP0H1H0_CLALP
MNSLPVTALSDNMVTAKSNIEKSKCRGDNTTSKEHRWPFDSFSEHQRRNSDQNLTLKPEFENFVKKLQSGEQTEDPSDGCMTTVGRRVKTGNPIVLVGEIKHSDGTAKKIVVLGTLRKHEEDNKQDKLFGSGDSAATLSQAFLPPTLQHHPKGTTSFAEEENVIPVAAEQENDEFKASNDTANPLRKFANNLKFRFVAASNRLKAKPKKFAKPLSIFKEKDDPSTSQSSSSSDEEYIELDLDTSAALSIGRKHHSTPDQSSNLKPKGKLLYRIPTASENPCRLERTLDKKMKIFRKEIKQITDGRLQLWKRHNKSWLDSNELRALKYNHSSLTLNNLIDPKNITKATAMVKEALNTYPFRNKIDLRMLKPKQDIYKYYSQLERKRSRDLGCEERSKTYNNSSFYRKFIDAVRQRVEIGSFRRGINLSDKYYDPEEDEGFIKPKLVKDITLYRKDGKGKLEELYNSDEMIDSQLTSSEEEFEPSDDTSSGSHQSALYSNGDYSVYSTNVSNSSVSENITSEPSSDEDDMTDENSSSPATSNSSDNSTSGKTETENSTEATASQTATSATYSTSSTSEDTYGTGDGYTSSKQSSTSVLQVSTGPKRRKTKEKISFKESKKAEDCKKLVCIGKRDSRQNISTGDFFVANSAGGDPNSLSATSAIKSFKRVRFANVSRMDCTMQGITNNMFNMISKSRLFKLETKSCTDLPSTRKNRKRFTYGKDVNSNLANEQRTKARYLDRTFVSNSFPLYEKGDYREIMHAMRKSLSMLKGSGQMNKHCDKYMYSQSVSEKMLPEDSTFHGKLKSNLTYSTEFHRRTIIQIGRNPGKGRNRNTVPVVRAGPTKNVQYSSEESNSSSETNTNKETNYDTVASQSTETDLSNKLPYSSQSYQRDTSETSADTQTERTYDSVAGSDENSYSLSKSADISLWSGTDDTTDINNSSVAATTSSGSDSNISSDSSEKRELPSAATASSGNDSNISIDKSNKSEFSSHTHTTISNTGKSKNYSLSVRLSTTRSLSWKKSKELPGFPGSIRVPGEFQNSTALNKFSSNENILSLNTSVHEADGSKLNITLSNTQKKDLSTPSSKTNCSALKTEELPGFPGSKSVCSEDQSQNTLKSCSSRSVPKLTNFFSFQQSLQDVNLDWSRSPKSNVFSKIHGQVADSVRKQKSLGSSQSLNSSISSEFNIFGDPKNPRKSFPAGLLKLGSQDYSSTNISGLTTWWDSESEIKTDVDKPSEASLQPLLEKDDREVRMRGIKNRKSVDFRSRAAMLYLRGDGLLMQTMQKKDHEKVGNYREYLKFSNKYGRLDVSPSLQDIHCLKAVERLQVSNTKDQAISGKLQLACDHPDCLSRHSPSNVKLPGLLPVEEQKTPAEVTLKDVTDLLTHSKIRKDLYYSDSEDSGQWTSSCKKCPQHQKRFFPFFPDLFEKYGIQPLAERVVDYAMLGGKESFNLHFPLYTEDDVDTFTDEFAFKALRDGVAKFLIEDAINTSWMDLQSEVLYQDLLRQEIRDTIHLGVIDAYSKSCINAGRRTIIIENYIKENTPPEVTVTKTESVRSLLPIPDLPDNSKFIAFSPTLPSNDETRDKLPGTDATGIIPIEGGDKTQNLMPSYLNTKITALKLISKATDKGIYRFLNPESIYETATELSFRSSDFDIHSEFLEDSGFASDDHITLQVGSLVDDMVAAVVISDELGLNSFQPMPMNDLYPNINEDVEFVVYKMVCQVSVCDELVNRGLASRNNALLKLPGYLSRKHTAPSNETSTGDSDTEQSTLIEASLSAESGSRSETKSQSSATYSSSPDRTYNDEKDSDSEDQESAPHVSTRAISNTKMKNKQLFRGLVKKTKILISSTARSNGTESHKSSTSKFPKSVKGLFKRFNPKRNKPDQRTHSNLVEENGSKVYTRQPEISNVSSDSSGSDYFPIDAILSENADDANCSKNIRYVTPYLLMT